MIRSALPPAWSQWWWVVNNVVKVTLGTNNKQLDYERYFLKVVSATHPLFFHSCYHRFRVHWVYYGCLKDCFRFEGHL